MFQGPLPPPEILARYNDVVPGCADRIISMAERQQSHRHNLERKVVFGGITSERFGQVLAFILYLSTLYFGTQLVLAGREAIGVGEMLVMTSTFIGLYLKAQREKKADLKAKDPRR
jgi:uncharacterized membrane protein